MGNLNNILQEYLSDNGRYADLYNGLCFAGEQVLRGEALEELPCRYHRTEPEERGRRASREYTRDLGRRCRADGFNGICAVELQETIDYTMPWRILNYDALEYRRQIRALRRANADACGRTVHERFSGLLRTDRLAPVHTVCLYHGTARWDGPRSLADLLDGNNMPDRLRKLLTDYDFHLVCLNEMPDLSVFKTPVRLVLEVLRRREDRQALAEELGKREYRSLDGDTWNAVGGILGRKWKKLDRTGFGEAEGGYDMCRAFEEICEDKRQEGRKEGMREGKKEGRKEGIREGMSAAISNLMQTMHLTAEQAMAALLVPEEEQAKYLRRLNCAK